MRCFAISRDHDHVDVWSLKRLGPEIISEDNMRITCQILQCSRFRVIFYVDQQVCSTHILKLLSLPLSLRLMIGLPRLDDFVVQGIIDKLERIRNGEED